MFWAETYIGPLYDDDGTLIGLRGTTRDVTRRQLAEEALRRSQERLDKIFRLSPGGIAIIHRDTGHYLDANQAYLEMLGLPREAVIGHTSAELGIMSQVQRNRLAAEVQARGYVRGFDTQILDARGQTVDVLYSAEQLEVDGEPYYLILTIDISRRKHMERELQQLNAELEDRVNLRTAALQEALGELQHASQLKDEFLAMISHELRTPINGVLNLAETLGDEVIGPLTPRQAQYVAGITQSGGRLLAVIDGILNYTQLLAGRVELRPEVCRVAALLDACAARQRDAAEAKQQALSVAVACQALTVVTDPRALSEVVDRLLENAVKFTPPGGQLGLTASPGAGAAVEIIVWDTGPGLTQMELAALVQPLAQADGRLARRHEGLGMGLAIAHQLLLLMGGRLEVQSEVGQGSRFVVTVGGGAN
jgi:PAS domain S-box-containing protein